MAEAERGTHLCVRDAQPFDSEFMLVSGDPKYVGICSSLAERIKELSLQRTGDETDDEQTSTSSSNTKLSTKFDGDSRCVCMDTAAEGCACKAGAVISNAWLDQWISLATPSGWEESSLLAAGAPQSARALLCITTSQRLRELAEEGITAVREVPIAPALAKSIKKSQAPLLMLFYTTDTHQFVGRFEVHPEGVTIQSQRDATAIVYRRLQLVAASMATVRTVLPKLAGNVTRQLKSTGPSCIILDDARDVDRLLGMMLQETLQRRHMQRDKLLTGTNLSPYCLLSPPESLEERSSSLEPSLSSTFAQTLLSPQRISSSVAFNATTVLTSSDVLRVMVGRKTLFVGDLLARQLYRHLASLVQGRESQHNPSPSYFGEMSCEDDILLYRTQTSVWSDGYVEERELRTAKASVSANSMLRATGPSKMTILRLYHVSALTTENVDDVMHHIVRVADALRVDNVYICFGAKHVILNAAPTQAFLPRFASTFFKLVSGLSEQLQCSLTCLLSPPASSGELPSNCPISEADRATVDLHLQLVNTVVPMFRKSFNYDVIDLWKLGTANLSDQLSDGAHYRSEAIRRFLLELCRPFFDARKGRLPPKSATVEEALFPGKGLSQRQLEVPIVSARSCEYAPANGYACVHTGWLYVAMCLTMAKENEVVWLCRGDAVVAYRFEHENEGDSSYLVKPFDRTAHDSDAQTVRKGEVLLQLEPLSILQTMPPPLQPHDTAETPEQGSAPEQAVVNLSTELEADMDAAPSQPPSPEHPLSNEEDEPEGAPQEPASEKPAALEDDEQEEEEATTTTRPVRKSARKRRSAKATPTAKRRKPPLDDFEVALMYEKQQAAKQANVEQKDED